MTEPAAEPIANQASKLHIKLLTGIAQQIETQDNACTSHPMVLVQQLVRDYGYDTDYADGYEWLDDDGQVTADDTRARRLEALYQGGRETPERYRRVGYKDRWEHVQTFFTVVAAEAFMERKGHDYRKLRVYIESGYWNPEWRALQKLFAESPLLLKAIETLAAASEMALAPKDKHKPINDTSMLKVVREILQKGDTPLWFRVGNGAPEQQGY